MNNMTSRIGSFKNQWLLAAFVWAWATTAFAQQLETRFSCSEARNEHGEAVTYADNGEIRLDGTNVKAFHWESALFRSNHGFDCSIDEMDGLEVEVKDNGKRDLWRVQLLDARTAREQRGFTFDRRLNCSIRLERHGDMLSIRPTCPALCGSRDNFSELSVDLKTGICHYDEY